MAIEPVQRAGYRPLGLRIPPTGGQHRHAMFPIAAMETGRWFRQNPADAQAQVVVAGLRVERGSGAAERQKPASWNQLPPRFTARLTPCVNVVGPIGSAVGDFL